ncbi:hypothetical protein [Solibaculum mannosilyticum]|uniref:Uncharacterized protein n=1 Tax=Solibaculum mannosilyticum TaxID=2780922 RepID=A0A7I8D4Y1_9FIRM|nr:hypothetical protein [Solibaculum mannosilyticum]MCO7136274.1 hypothetical protein [[Clostridium] leptum]BCI60273.1 hypothetical protein C12CBH8_09120 [Solibaculum mannosilyticum]CZT55065.1 hypothetical protein BN3661_00136 [Eubacteriaceae bacterium CHKCI005]
MSNSTFGNVQCENSAMQQYFMSLPTYIQETIKQSGAQITTQEELRQCAENLMKFKN